MARSSFNQAIAGCICKRGVPGASGRSWRQKVGAWQAKLEGG